ncbi:maltose alpha-D-glucosyltransferase [Nitriliruptor alkaliphilus]|uniref:maltose alpha-D-glucosyltransferase n=1 Tax=Nitriliruptor alkaliphilus TaxID=427918 RepID=UPI0006975EBB|nr:maltose alpha-D-glucosyltransferase [Nitriliruptor alkaliphilus]
MTVPQDGAIITDPQWYRDAVIYSCHVRSFADSNGDGFGDFRGLADRLDYLQDLGVTAIWLLPFYPSPLRDDGYDIADYTSIHPDYGTMRQFKRFVKEAHARGLKVITELVINHTSDQHPWFQRAVAAPKGSRYRDWYVWSDTPDPYPEVRIIFQDFETSNWQWHPEAGQYYWHRFFSHQPDLNFDNPEVHEALKGVLDFWAEIGVDGFRLDAIPYLFEREGTNGENLPETHDYLKELRAHLDERWPGRMFLAEANQWPEDAAEYFGDGDECHMNFHFPLMPRLFMAVRQEDRFPVIDILQQTPEVPDGAQWALFLRNHDELTLEMVTDEERDFMYRAYAHDARMRINLGIRRRLSPLLGGDRRLIEMMNSLMFSMPGTPVLYYGDEIGMGDNIWLGDRNGVRTPMQWSADRNAGFSSANPQRLYLPVVIDPEYHYERINVESQEENASSLLLWMKRLIALRQRNTQLFGRGDIEFAHPDNPKVLAYLRRWQPPDGGPEQIVLVVANLSRHAQSAQIPLAEHHGLSPVEMFGRTAFPPITDQPYPLTLGPYQFYWFSIERAPSRLSLSQMREFAGAATVETAEPVPELTLAGEWRALLRGPGRERLEAVLPAILRRQRWFGGKAREVGACHVVDVAPLGRKDDPALHLLIVRVEYVDGEPEEYVLAVGFAEGEDAGRVAATAPTAVLAHVRGRGPRGHTGILYDVLQDEEAGRVLLDTVARGRRSKTSAGELVGRREPALGTKVRSSELPARMLRGEQSNTSIIYGDRYLMKVLRRLEPGESPDVEVGRFLTGRVAHVPELLGTIDHVRRGGGEPSTLAILQRFVPNEGDAWVHTLDELERYAERVMTDPPVGGVPDLKRSALALAEEELPESAHELLGPYLDVAHLLGQRTAEMHVALADDGGRKGDAFSPEPFTSLYQRSLYQSMRNALRRGLQQAGKASGSLTSTDARQRVADLAAREDELLQRLRTLSDTRIEVSRIRTHGDYHLGQVLWTGRDLVIIDFEGEPARPLGERRLKRSALRDVAGMLRSFQYASHSALRFQVERGAVTPERESYEELRSWLAVWNRWTSAGFLRGYLTTAAGHGFVPDDPDHTAILLDTFLLEKAIYELGYEMNNRPEWVDIPLTGIAEVLGDPPT